MLHNRRFVFAAAAAVLLFLSFPVAQSVSPASRPVAQGFSPASGAALQVAAPLGRPFVLQGDALAAHRPVPRRPDQSRRRRAAAAERLLHRRRQRRRLEDDRLRTHLEADLRRPADRLDRRDRRRAVRPEHHLRRQRRRAAAARPLHRRRHLQVHRRRQDLDAPRPPRRPADPADHRRPARSRTGCSSPCSAIRTGRTRSAASSARPTAAGPSRRCSTRTRTPAAIDVAFDPANAEHALRRAVGGAAGAVGERRLHRPGQRPVQVHRRRRRPGGRSTNGLPTFARGTRPHRHRGRAERSAAAVRDGRRRRQRAGSTAPTTPARRWRDVNDDARVHRAAASDFAEVKVDPKNPDIVYTGSIVAWKSTDGGKTFTRVPRRAGRRRLPPHLDQPRQPGHHPLAADQGAVITVNGGETWSSWYNQPTAQFYHVTTDNAFPYRVCGGQQESGSACVPSRGDDGQITFRDWHPVGVEEYGYVAPDPLDPDIVYGGKVTRFDRRTGQAQNVAPKPLPVRQLPRAAHGAGAVLAGRPAHAVLRVEHALEDDATAGSTWTEISPDLTRETWDVPAERRRLPRARRRRSRRSAASIYTIAPVATSTSNVIWAGTDDGLIHVTRDGGKTWTNVTPPELDAVGEGLAHRRVALRHARPPTPRSTRSGSTTCGRTSTARATAARRGPRSSAACPTARPINVVREDPQRRGLLFAGTRDAGLRLVRRRRALAVAAAEHAGDVDPRPRHQGRRPRRRHARPRVLDPRRHHAAAAAHAGRRERGRAPVQAAARRGGSAGTRTPTRRCRRTSPPARIRPTARSSTTG